MTEYGATERVRRMALERYILPARQRGETTVTIHSGTLAKAMVEKALLGPNRYPIVCNALRSKRFSRENHLTLKEVRSPAPSGQSSTVTFVFRLDAEELDAEETAGAKDTDRATAAFLGLRGIFKEGYKELGGAEAFHTAERESWDR